ncbi:PASTA domain-containing protein [Paraflavisolibacter sp. H34]|uniref:PASTA domain-containing protein n=1 Tax=Huijunlia imazamoxiresistens TaxID=3127457 RepID=UPI003018F1E2
MFKFITSRPLWVNIVFGTVLFVALFLLFVLSLNWLTHHGESKTVPAVVGKKVEEVRELLDEQGFEMIVQDSVYFDTLAPSVVIKQVPEADAVVKINRTVYVTVNRVVAPDVDMPNLIGYSFRNAEMVLNNMGLKIGDTTFKPDFAKNSVLEQLFNGQSIPAGKKIRMGSAISLVLGNGLGARDMPVPQMIGLTYAEAKILMETRGLILGAVVPDGDVQDTANAFVTRQSPAPRNEAGQSLRIRPGQMVDVWLSVQKPVTDSTEATQTQPVNTQTEL